MLSRKDGQMIVEYVVMFTVLVAVILYASLTFVKPAANRFFNTATGIMDNATSSIENIF